MLPSRVAPLFFFDGEKIEQYANLERSSEILSTAVHALLGLDIVQRLQTDLQVFERRKKVPRADAPERKEIEAATAKLEASEARLRDLRERRASANNGHERAIKAFEEARGRFRAEGGELYVQREQLSEQRGEKHAQLQAVERGLRQLASEATPLCLVMGLLSEIAEEADRELATQQAATVLEVLQERDAQTVRRLQSEGASTNLVAALEAYLATERHRLARTAEGERVLRLSEDGRRHLSNLLAAELAATRSAVATGLDELARAQADLAHLDHQLAGIPALETFEPLLQRIRDAEQALAAKERELAVVDVEIATLEREAATQRGVLASMLDRELRRKLDNEDSERMLLHSVRARETLAKFRTRVLQHHLARLEARILECFAQLVRKETLIAAVKIDPESFAIELRGGDWRPIPTERLSAGERQLLAVSLLWALGRASGRAAPTVIDTPLSRLDSIHRANLVERYFPRASHQVILLSTDEELDERHLRTLSPWISRNLRVDFDPASGASTVREGYFFEGSG